MENEIEKENSINPEMVDNSESTTTGEQELPKKPESAPAVAPVRQDIYERMRKAEKEAKELKEQISKRPSIAEIKDPMEIVRLTKALEGYSESEVDFIIRNTTDKSIDNIILTTKDEWVKDAIDVRRKKVAEQNKVPAPGSSSPFSATKKSGAEIQEKLKGKNPQEQSEIMRKMEEEAIKEERERGI